MAGATIQQNVTVSVAGKTILQSRAKVLKQLKTVEPTLLAAKTGQLTTRTDNDTGTLTMTTGHGITTGQRLDIYWVDGSGVPGHRRGVTVGTVSGDLVPIDLGAGDNLPANLTNVTAQVPEEDALVVTGNNVKSITVYTPKKGIVVFADGSNVELHFRHHPEGGTVYYWDLNNGDTNPLSGDSVAKLFFSNGDSTGTNDIQVAIGHD